MNTAFRAKLINFFLTLFSKKFAFLLFILMMLTVNTSFTLSGGDSSAKHENCDLFAEWDKLSGMLLNERRPFNGVKTVVIDAGHGGKDPGCNGLQHKEKNVALSIAIKFGKYIQENMKDVKVVFTRSTDEFIELQERARIANKADADLFVCIHCNANKNKESFGAETYVMGLHKSKGNLEVAKRENSAILMEDNYKESYGGFDPNSDEGYILMTRLQNSFLMNSLLFASKVQSQLKDKVGRFDRGVKQAGFLVLWKTSMPSVLIETGFLTNPEEEKFLGSEKGQDFMALALFRAFREYKSELEGSMQKFNDEIEKMVPGAQDLISIKDTAINMSKIDSVQSKNIVPEKKDTSSVVSIPKTEIEKTKTIENAGNLLKDRSDTLKVQVNSNVLADTVLGPFDQELVFKVQLFSSEKLYSRNDNRFKMLSDVGIYKDGKVYKYTSGKYNSLEEASRHQAELKNGTFSDAFVVAFKGGKRIPVNDAIKEINK